MDFETVCKEFERMCSCGCDECPIRDAVHFESQTLCFKTVLCFEWILKNPCEAELLIMMWRKEHTVITNADKFKKVFGKPIGSYGAPCPNGLTIYEIGTMSNLEWLRQEYKEPEEDDNGNDR